MRWNILITGGRVIDPFQGIDGIRDVAIEGTRVAEIGENLPADQAETVIDAGGKVVTAGPNTRTTGNRIFRTPRCGSIRWCGCPTRTVQNLPRLARSRS